MYTEIKISEETVASIWQQQLVTGLVTDDGKSLQVIHAGRASSGEGCDFQDAVLILNGKRVEGDVEIHVKSSQWYSHRHHQNQKYNKIVLHITMWHDSQSPTLLQNGKAIPTVCLSAFISRPLNELIHQAGSHRHPLPSCPQATNYTCKESLNRILDKAGEKRFTDKAASIKKAILWEDPAQVLFQDIARALGYTKNTRPFKELTHRLPLSFLCELKNETDTTMQALLLGTAGLLPSQRPKLQHRLIAELEVEDLEKSWQSINVDKALKESDWCFFRVRPDNFPTRRLIALSHLLARYQNPGLLQGILNLVNEAPPETEHRWLENGLVVIDQGYWSSHYDFGVSRNRTSALLGQRRAAEIAVNIILPFAAAWGELAASPVLTKKATQIYHRYPKLENNELTRYMKQQLQLKADYGLSARRQQGLIHIFKVYCRHRNCAECPVNLQPRLRLGNTSIS